MCKTEEMRRGEIHENEIKNHQSTKTMLIKLLQVHSVDTTYYIFSFSAVTYLFIGISNIVSHKEADM